MSKPNAGPALADEPRKPLPILPADQIVEADDTEYKIVEVPQWGTSIRIRSLTMREAEDLWKASQRPNPETGAIEADGSVANALAMQKCIVEPEFTPEQVERLRNKSAQAVGIVVSEIMAINGWGTGGMPGLFRRA